MEEALAKSTGSHSERGHKCLFQTTIVMLVAVSLNKTKPWRLFCKRLGGWIDFRRNANKQIGDRSRKAGQQVGTQDVDFIEGSRKPELGIFSLIYYSPPPITEARAMSSWRIAATSNFFSDSSSFDSVVSKSGSFFRARLSGLHRAITKFLT